MTPSIEAIGPLRPAVLIETDQAAPAGGGSSFAALLDTAASSLQRADDETALLAAGRGSIAQAAIARAKADVALEVAAITASRVSGAVTALLQTQVSCVLARLPASVPRLVEDCTIWLHHRRRPVAAVTCGVIVTVLAGALLAHNTAPVPLFDVPLHPRQAAEVEQALTLWNEPFSANVQGTQLYVPARLRRKLLVRLALADLPHGYVPTTADVLAAQDNPLTPPEIVDDRRRAGIKRFVAAGYPGLSTDKVAVVDGSGELIGSPPDRGASREARIQSNVQSALDAALGPGAAIVRVSMRSAGSEQSTQSTRVVPHGLLDADTGRENGTESGRKLDKERTTRHYAYDTIVERRTTAADALVRMSVAVFLDAARTDASHQPAIASLVRAAAGADLDAGDDVVVESVPFAVRTKPAIAAAPMPLARAVLPAAALALVAVAFGFTLWPQRHRKTPDPAIAGLRSSLERESPRTAAYVLSTLPSSLRERVLQSYGPLRRASIEACLRERRAR